MSAIRETLKGNSLEAQVEQVLSSGKSTIVDWKATSIFSDAEKLVESKFGYSAKLTPNQKEAASTFSNYQVDKFTPESIGTAANVAASAMVSPAAGGYDWSDYGFPY